MPLFSLLEDFFQGSSGGFASAMRINVREIFRPALGDYVDTEGFEAEAQQWLRGLDESSDPRGYIQGKKMEYIQQAHERAKKGEDFHHILCLSMQMSLLDYKAGGEAERVEVVTGCCEACDEKLEGKVFDIDEALKTAPLPAKECTRFDYEEGGWCVCDYVALDGVN